MIASLACNALKLCVGVGYGNAGAGLASASSSPTLGAGAWIGSAIGSDPPAQGAGLVDGVSCPERNFCVAVDSASNAYTSSTPVRGGWSAAKPLKKASQATISQIACNTKLCVEVDNRGTVTYGVVKAASSTPTKTTTTTTTTTKTTHQDHVDEDADPQRHGLTRARVPRVDARRAVVTVRPRLTLDNLAP